MTTSPTRANSLSFLPLQIGNVSVEKSNNIAGLLACGLKLRPGDVPFIPTDCKGIHQLKQGSSSVSAELAVLLPMMPPISLRHIGCHGNGGSSHLLRERESLVRRQRLQQAVDTAPEATGLLVHFQVFEAEWTSIFAVPLAARNVPICHLFPPVLSTAPAFAALVSLH